MSSNPIQNNQQQGFVLPYVLVVIAILALVTSIAAQRLQAISSTLMDIEAHAQGELAFMSAESDAIFSILTSSNMRNGLDLNPHALIRTDFGIMTPDMQRRVSVQEAQAVIPNFWAAAGGKRKSVTPYGTVLITLQDASGLFPLNSARQSDIAKLLTGLGVTSPQNVKLAATLSDYVDFDNKRQFQGAERADYALRKLRPPTNAGLRNIEELTGVLGWENIWQKLDYYRLMDMTTLGAFLGIKPAFAPEFLKDTLAIGSSSLGGRRQSASLDSAVINNKFPSGRFRMCFEMRNQLNSLNKRCIDIKRQANHIDKPYQRFWVYQRHGLGNDAASAQPVLSKVKNVIHAASIQAQ